MSILRRGAARKMHAEGTEAMRAGGAVGVGRGDAEFGEWAGGGIADAGVLRRGAARKMHAEGAEAMRAGGAVEASLAGWVLDAEGFRRGEDAENALRNCGPAYSSDRLGVGPRQCAPRWGPRWAGWTRRGFRRVRHWRLGGIACLDGAGYPP